MKTAWIYCWVLLASLPNCSILGDKRDKGDGNDAAEAASQNRNSGARHGATGGASVYSRTPRCKNGLSALTSKAAVEKAIQDGRLVSISLGRAYEDEPTCINCIKINSTLEQVGCEKPSDYAMYTLNGDEFGQWFTEKYGKPAAKSYPFLYFFRDGKLVTTPTQSATDETSVRELLSKVHALKTQQTPPAPPAAAKAAAETSCPSDDPCVQRLSAALRTTNGPAGSALQNKPLIVRFANDCPNCEVGADIHGELEPGGALEKAAQQGHMELAMFYFQRNPNSSDYDGTTIPDGQKKWPDAAQWSKVKHRYTGSFAQRDLDELRGASLCGDFGKRVGARFDDMAPNLIFDRSGRCVAALSVWDGDGAVKNLRALLENKTASPGAKPKEAAHTL